MINDDKVIHAACSAYLVGVCVLFNITESDHESSLAVAARPFLSL